MKPAILLLVLAVATCRDHPGSLAADPGFVGSWRILSERIFFDEGGSGHLDNKVTRRLELLAGGTWKFGSSSGKWEIGIITDSDWKEWKTSAYGPKRKIVLAGWNGREASGPIEESDAGIDYVWLIYRESPPAVSAPGIVQMKFGRAR